MKTITDSFKFPVQLTPVADVKFGVRIPNRSAVIRTDTKTPIGIVSTKYELLKHEEVVNALRKALKGEQYEEKIQVTKNGAHLFATYKLPNQTVEIRKGDMVALQFVAKNSYDGNNSLRLMMGAWRLVCSNGMVIGRTFFQYSQRHIGSETGVKINIIQDQISGMTEQLTKTLPFLKEMSKTEVKGDLETLFDAKAFNLPAYIMEEARVSFENGRDTTIWGYYNALTFAISNRMKKENPRQVLGFGKVAWDAAYEQVMATKKA